MDKINGAIMKGMLESACNNLNNHKKDVDALNVFPVPDGDTGTNMSLTFTNGMAEVVKSGSESLPVVTKTLSRGLLMGARGNSGVILSQIFRGFNQSVGVKEELNAKDFSDAMVNGSKLAYKAVMRPVEGTILTVIRESSQKGAEFVEGHPECSLEEYVAVLCAEAEASLGRTPELLPVLKEAHVVDSGGSGLKHVLDGFKAYLDGKPIAVGEAVAKIVHEKNEKASGYRTEYILSLSNSGKNSFKEERVRKSLEKIGNNLTLILDGDTVKLRINTMMPGEVLTLGQRYGEFVKIQIENIQDELKPSILDENEPEVEMNECGMIAVAAGEGLKKMFALYGVDIVVSGGQTMNPSTEDFVTAIKKVNARNIFIFPNNSNIIMAAKQAAEVTDDKNVIVIETKSIPQGIAACVSFNPQESVEAITETMNDAITSVKTGQVTYAIKDTTMDGREIHSGDYMGICGKEIVVIGQDKLDVTKKLLSVLCDEDSEMVTLIAGEDASKEECDALQEYLEEFEVDVDFQQGGQPVYSFIIGVE